MKVLDVLIKYDNEWICVLYADTKDDIGETIIGLPDGIDLGSGSIVYTADFDIAIYDDDHTWRWK